MTSRRPTNPVTNTRVPPRIKIAVVGAGTMGVNIALSLATNGWAVCLCDSDPAQLERAETVARSNTELLCRQNLLAGATVENVVARIAMVSRLEQAVDGVGLVIEAVSEKIQLKQQLFRHLDHLCRPDTILASNSSTFVPSRMAVGFEHAERKARFLVMHYWNPAHLIPLVEIVPHPETSPHVVEFIQTLLRQCGKTPVVVKKEMAGFIGNRLAFALQREAMDLVAKGVASPEDIDAVARTGFGRRLPVCGIFGTADLGGLDVYLEACRSLFPELCNEPTPPAALRRLVEQGNLGVKSGVGWRSYTPKEISDIKESLAAELIHQLHRDRREHSSRYTSDELRANSAIF